MAKIGVLLANGHTIFRMGLREIIEGQSDMTVVGEAKDGIEAMDKAEELAPDIILMNMEMPGLDGLRATDLITGRHPEIGIIILSTYPEEEYVFEALRCGAQGYILKEAQPEELLEAIRTVHCGEATIDSTVASKALMKVCQRVEGLQEPGVRLTKREHQILSFVAQGASNREIAEMLELSETTVRNRLSALFKKLGVRNRTEAASYALQEGLLTPV